MSEPATDTPECAHSASISGAHTEEGNQIVSNMTDTADAHKVVHTDTGVHDAISISDSSAVLTEGSVGPIGDIQSISDISSSTCYVDVQNSDIQPSADIMQAAGESALSQDQMEAHAAFQADINQQVMSSELQGDEAVGQFHAEMQQGEVTEETTTIYAYIDSEGNLRGRSSTGEDVLLQVEGDMPDDISSDAILEDNGNVVVIQNCDPDSMIHTEGDVTYIVQQQPDEDEISDQALQQHHIPFPANANAQLKDNIGGNQEETNSATAAANLVYFEEEACSLETAEFQIVGVEVETQGQENQTEPSIIIDGCQVICQEPSSSSSSSSKKRKSPNKQESTSPAKSNGKPKKPRKRKSSQKDSSPLSDGTAEEPKEKVTVQNLYDKSVEMCITENNSSQKLPDNPTAVNDTEDPSPKSKRRNKGDPSKPRRRSKKSSEQDGNSSPRGAIVSTEQGKFEESDLSKTLDTATSVINQTMSAVGCEDVPCGSALVASPAPQAVPFSCRLCHKFSSHTEEEVKTHIVKEHARKICFIYRCDLCPAFFVTEPEITEHFKEKHPVAHVENISIVTDIEKALQTSADNIKIFYEKKKSGSSTSEVANIPQSPPPFPSQHKAKSPKKKKVPTATLR